MAGLKRRTAPSEKKEYEKLADGDHEARLVYIADMGMQESMEWQGEKKPDCQQISLGFEILGNKVLIGEVEQPRILWTKPFNIFASLTEKGNELKHYRVFDKAAQGGDDADWEAVLGTPCSVIVGRSKNGDYDEIKGLEPIPSKYLADVAEGELTPAIGDSDDADNVVNGALFGLAKYVFDRRITDTAF